MSWKIINSNLSERKAKIDDLSKIIDLLLEDDLGKTREIKSDQLDRRYIDVFQKIDNDENQYLMVMEGDGDCDLTMIPSLGFVDSLRLNIENVHVSQKYRGQKIGEWIMEKAIEYGKVNCVSIIQLTTNKKRIRAKIFYERLGFEVSHEMNTGSL
jgi:ribosomal protein S18 acetylase RimI-like enzyme